MKTHNGVSEHKYTNPEAGSVTDVSADPSSMSIAKRFTEVTARAVQSLCSWVCGQVSLNEAIHPDFRTPMHVADKQGEFTWHQNIDWGPFPDPPYKVGFYFDDPVVLNDCPWVCKIAPNRNPNIAHKYFAVSFGDPGQWDTDFGLAEMKKWALQFQEPSLMKYDGTLLEMLTQGE
jgi:hypothetical protein